MMHARCASTRGRRGAHCRYPLPLHLAVNTLLLFADPRDLLQILAVIVRRVCPTVRAAPAGRRLLLATLPRLARWLVGLPSAR